MQINKKWVFNGVIYFHILQKKKKKVANTFCHRKCIIPCAVYRSLLSFFFVKYDTLCIIYYCWVCTFTLFCYQTRVIANACAMQHNICDIHYKYVYKMHWSYCSIYILRCCSGRHLPRRESSKDYLFCGILTLYSHFLYFWMRIRV